VILKGQQVDLYYENVGEDMLSSMLQLMADHSKIVMCGATATYNAWRKKAGVKNMENIIFKRIEVKGILYYNIDFSKMTNAFVEMTSLNVKGADVIIKGIEHLPEVYRDMINGKFIGKPVVQLADQV
jgi:NADPH-dependent curcumin reductase CurA